METFMGFKPPIQNWSKLPHQMIEALPLVETLGELKVILYILRHTWGYQDNAKKITLEEFEFGRKRHDQTRLDAGTGLARSTIIEGLKRAVSHGFIQAEEDSKDKGRRKKFYSLKMADVSELRPPEVAKSDPRGMKTLPPAEKDTLDRNLLCELASSPHEQASTQEVQASTQGVIEEEPRKKNIYTDTQTAWLSLFGAERFKTKAQAAAVLEFEEKYGSKATLDAARWAAELGMNVGKSIVSCRTALRKKKAAVPPRGEVFR